MKVLVTGATGYIGTYVVQSLINRKLGVIATSTSNAKMQMSNLGRNITFIPFNLAEMDDQLNYFEYFSKPDLMIHLAWEGLPNYTKEFHLTENLPRHKAFLNNMLRNGLNNLSVAGTCMEYGLQSGELCESMPVAPITYYATAKNELRVFLESLHASHQFSFKWIRLFYMYGKGQSTASILSQLNKAVEMKEECFNMSGGDQLRDYLPVEKIASNIVTIALQSKIDGIINNCSGIPISIKQLVANHLEKLGNPVIKLNFGVYPYSTYEPMSFWGNTDKLNKICHS